MRNGLSYEQASANANRKAQKAYNDAKSLDCSVELCQYAAFKAYEDEMKYYES